jgi:hypothetical protein
MTKRRLSDEVHPIVGYLFASLIMLLFVGLSMLLFYKIAYAPYVYVLISLFFTSKLSEARRNDFLKICFGNERYIKVRILENLILAFPFMAFLVYKQQVYPTITLVVFSILIALRNYKTVYHVTIPTPFFKNPFEFTVGFRNTFYIFFGAYGLSIIAVTVNNFNLGVFALMLILFTVLSYYLKPENEYFVWSHSFSPTKFLIEKISVAFLFTFSLCTPVLILMSIFFFDNFAVLLLFALLGHLYLAAVILAKYSAYPNEMELTQAILMTICISFPPMLVVVIPFFAHKSVIKLKSYLK